MSVWTGNIYGFGVSGGSLVRVMKGGNGPGQKCPLFSEIFTPTFTPNGLSRVGLKPPGVLGGAISGFWRLLRPVNGCGSMQQHSGDTWASSGYFNYPKVRCELRCENINFGVNIGVNTICM